VFQAGVEGVLRRLGDMLSVRNGSGCTEKWTSVSPCPPRPTAVCQGALHHQGLTLVGLTAQRKRFWCDKGYLGGV
jgi:hypothetical protein